MTTTSVSTAASSAPALPSGPSSASRKSENAGNPFQQMLSNEIRGMTQNAAKSGERNADAPASHNAKPPVSSEKTASAANASDTSKTNSGEEGKEDETADTGIPTLSPELAAMIANLLQRQSSAATPAEEGETTDADPLTLLGKGNPHQGAAGMQAKDKALPDDADPRLPLADERASQSAGQSAVQSGASSKPALDLQAASAGKHMTIDSTAKEAQPSDFNNVLQQLNQANQAAPARSAQQATQTHIGPRVGSQGWDQALGQRMVWMANGTEQSASLTLNPPELGPLQVTLNVSNNQANATFLAPHADVRQALEAALPKLREMLGEVGIQLDQASVGQDTPQQQSEFARSDGRGGSQSGTPGSAEPTIAEAVTTSRGISAGNGLVDTFA